MTQIEIPYQPHQHQEKFHNSDKRIKFIIAGIRAGKTLACLIESILLSLKGWKTFDVPNTGCIVAPTYPMLRDVIVPQFEQYCPPKVIRSFNKWELTCTFTNGSRILFRSSEYPERLRGLDLHWFYMDEAALMEKIVYDILMGRISQKQGCALLSTTPKGPGWIKDLIESGDPDLFCKPFTSMDNPYFPREEIERLRSLYNDQFFEQELEARFITISGLIYPSFDREIHVKKVYGKFQMEKYICGVDFGFAVPTSILSIGIKDGIYNVVKEHFESSMIIPKVIEKIQEFNTDFKFARIYCDPSHPDFIKQMNDSFLRAEPGIRSVDKGISKIRDLLASEKLYVDETCDNLIREFQTYHFKPGIDKPVKKDDHALDALRYALSSDIKPSSGKMVSY